MARPSMHKAQTLPRVEDTAGNCCPATLGCLQCRHGGGECFWGCGHGPRCWSEEGPTLVIPGKSTRVRLTTLGEKIFRWMGSGLTP